MRLQDVLLEHFLFTMGGKARLLAAFNPGAGLLEEGVAWEDSVQVATTGPLPSSSYDGRLLTMDDPGNVYVDDVELEAGFGLLVKDEPRPERNGIYVVFAPGSSSTRTVLRRRNDMAPHEGVAVFVTSGYENHDTGWVVGPCEQGWLHAVSRGRWRWADPERNTGINRWERFSGPGVAAGSGLT